MENKLLNGGAKTAEDLSFSEINSLKMFWEEPKVLFIIQDQLLGWIWHLCSSRFCDGAKNWRTGTSFAGPSSASPRIRFLLKVYRGQVLRGQALQVPGFIWKVFWGQVFCFIKIWTWITVKYVKCCIVTKRLRCHGNYDVPKISWKLQDCPSWH